MILDYRLEWTSPMLGSLRLGHVTINPDAFTRDQPFYATHNGGYALENFRMSEASGSKGERESGEACERTGARESAWEINNGETIDHSDAISFLVSAKQALGCTGGLILLGDERNCLHISIDKTVNSLVPMVQFHRVGPSYICRLIWSAREMDDTSKASEGLAVPLRCRFRISAAGCAGKPNDR